MTWSIRWTDQGLRDLGGLDPPIAQRVVSKLDEAAKRPEHYFRRVVGSDEFRLRVGDYRVLVALDQGTGTIFVERVGHRSDIYQR